MNVQKLFTPAPKPGALASEPAPPPAKAPEKPASGGAPAKAPGLMETMELYFKEIVAAI